MSQRITKTGSVFCACLARLNRRCAYTGTEALLRITRPATSTAAFTHSKNRTDRLTSSGTSQPRLNMFLRKWKNKKWSDGIEKAEPRHSGSLGRWGVSRKRKQVHGKVDKVQGHTRAFVTGQGWLSNATQITNVPQLFTTIQACYFSQRSCSLNIDFVCSVAKKNQTASALQKNRNTDKKPCPL